MNRYRVFGFAVLVGLTASGCIHGEPDGLDGTEQENEVVTFPGFESLPRESCDTDFPLTCPTQTFSLRHLKDYLTNEQVTVTFTRATTATVDGQSTSCKTGDFVTTAFKRKIRLPEGVTVSLLPDRSAAVFSQDLIRSDGAIYCGFDCTPGGALPRGCTQSGLTNKHFEGVLTVNGKSKTVQLRSEVDGNPVVNPTTREFEMQCRLTLPGSVLTTEVRKRPDDVISGSGDRFVRGYELTGDALRGACSSLANKSCQPPSGERHLDGLGDCIRSHTDECVETFSNEDPCIPRPIPVIR